MNLYLKKQPFLWNSKYSVYDEKAREKMLVKRKTFFASKGFRILDTDEKELISVQKKMYGAEPRFHIIKNGIEAAVVEKDFSMFSRGYRVNGLGWRAEGRLSEHEFELRNGDIVIAKIANQMFAGGNGYEISFGPDVDELMALSVILAVNTCIDSENNS